MEFLRFLMGIRNPVQDVFFGLVTRLGEETVTIVVLCVLYWCVSKKLAYGIGVAYFVSGLSVQGLKIAFRVERPWALDPSIRPVGSALTAATGYSFPSGHTQAAAALFGTLGFAAKKRWQTVACLMVVVLVGFSRMYLGVHTPVDVFTGMALTLVAVWIVTKFLMTDYAYSHKREIILASSLAVLAFAVLVLALSMYNNGIIEYDYVSDCCKAVGAGFGFAVGMYAERRYIQFDTKTDNNWMQILKFVLGFAGLMAVKEGLKLIIGTGLAVDTLRYFLVIIWAIAVFPIIIKKCFQKKTKE